MIKKTLFSCQRTIYHPEYAIFQGGLISLDSLVAVVVTYYKYCL